MVLPLHSILLVWHSQIFRYVCPATNARLKLKLTGTEHFEQKPPGNNEMFEKEPTSLHPGIKIMNLRKVFGNKKTAVRDMYLNMYENHITVLLGHNGAGKTTTMSMLTGILTPTSGTALVGGYDIRTEMDKVRDSLGLCPQHNIIFEEFTVKEHLYFFSKLKGVDKKDIDREIQKYVELLELVPKVSWSESWDWFYTFVS